MFSFDRKVDPEMGERYAEMIDWARASFSDSSLIDESQQLGAEDVQLIFDLYEHFNPVETKWRTDDEYNKWKSQNAWYLQDGSTFNNWNEAGGPMEHVHLSVEAVTIIFEILKQHLRDDINPEIRQQFEKINPKLLESIMAFHDIGRLFTHTFFTNGVIGDRLLKSLGVREDILQNLPTESVMLTPTDEDMDTVIENLGVIAVIARLADEFGKRSPGTNRLYTPNDYDKWDRESWANGYMNKPATGRPSDRFFRKNVQLHKDNVPRYFAALNTWVQKVSTLSLNQLVEKMQERIGELLSLPEQK